MTGAVETPLIGKRRALTRVLGVPIKSQDLGNTGTFFCLSNRMVGLDCLANPGREARIGGKPPVFTGFVRRDSFLPASGNPGNRSGWATAPAGGFFYGRGSIDPTPTARWPSWRKQMRSGDLIHAAQMLPVLPRRPTHGTPSHQVQMDMEYNLPPLPIAVDQGTVTTFGNLFRGDK